MDDAQLLSNVEVVIVSHLLMCSCAILAVAVAATVDAIAVAVAVVVVVSCHGCHGPSTRKTF